LLVTFADAERYILPGIVYVQVLGSTLCGLFAVVPVFVSCFLIFSEFFGLQSFQCSFQCCFHPVAYRFAYRFASLCFA